MTFKHFIVSVLVAALSQAAIAQNVVKHEVRAGETLYSLSKKYNVSIQAIQQANNLTGENIRAGEIIKIPAGSKPASVPATTIAKPTAAPATTPAARPATSTTPRPATATAARPATATTAVQQVARPVAAQPQGDTTPSLPDVEIPKCKLTYITEAKTTVDAICAKFGVSREALLAANPHIKKNKIKKNIAVCIPYTASEIADIRRRAAEEARRKAQEEEERRLAEEAKKKIPNINVALILPFELSHDTKSQEAIKMIDFYEGMILAAEELQAGGANISINVYDEGEKTISTILNELSSQNVHLIIGAKSAEYINSLRDFAKKNNITMAVPFSSREDITVGYPTVFQVNSKASTNYDRIYNAFVSENIGSNVVFVQNETTDDVRYIEGFKSFLTSKGIAQSVHTPAELSDMLPHMGGQRTVLIPTSKSVGAFREIADMLSQLDGSVTSKLAMFGYPEWQTFSIENTHLIRRYHGSFYTTFYADLTSSDVLAFTKQFKSKFKRDQYNSRPLYGLIGYDVTRFFVGGLHQFGTDFIVRQDEVHINALQNPMLFERNLTSASGFINKNIRIIHP